MLFSCCVEDHWWGSDWWLREEMVRWNAYQKDRLLRWWFGRTVESGGRKDMICMLRIWEDGQIRWLVGKDMMRPQACWCWFCCSPHCSTLAGTESANWSPTVMPWPDLNSMKGIQHVDHKVLTWDLLLLGSLYLKISFRESSADAVDADYLIDYLIKVLSSPRWPAGSQRPNRKNSNLGLPRCTTHRVFQGTRWTTSCKKDSSNMSGTKQGPEW